MAAGGDVANGLQVREELGKVSFRGASGDITFTPDLDLKGGSFEIVTNVHNWDVAKGEGVLASVGSYDAGTQTFRMSDDRLQHLPKERRMAICGNGILTAGQETCDDGNSNDGDGCSAQCTVEETYTCTNPTCGASTCCVGMEPDSFRRCFVCPAGTYQDGTECKKCEIGTYGPLDGLSRCLPCSEGYTDTDGRVECSECPARTMRRPGSKGVSILECLCIPSSYPKNGESQVLGYAQLSVLGSLPVLCVDPLELFDSLVGRVNANLESKLCFLLSACT